MLIATKIAQTLLKNYNLTSARSLKSNVHYSGDCNNARALHQCPNKIVNSMHDKGKILNYITTFYYKEKQLHVASNNNQNKA